MRYGKCVKYRNIKTTLLRILVLRTYMFGIFFFTSNIIHVRTDSRLNEIDDAEFLLKTESAKYLYFFFLLSPVLTESLQSQYQCLKNEVQACNDFQWNKLRWLKKNERVLEIEYLIFVYHL